MGRRYGNPLEWPEQQDATAPPPRRYSNPLEWTDQQPTQQSSQGADLNDQRTLDFTLPSSQSLRGSQSAREMTPPRASSARRSSSQRALTPPPAASALRSSSQRALTPPPATSSRRSNSQRGSVRDDRSDIAPSDSISHISRRSIPQSSASQREIGDLRLELQQVKAALAQEQATRMSDRGDKKSRTTPRSGS